jgi:myo-inositol-1-phosphate synthase
LCDLDLVPLDQLFFGGIDICPGHLPEAAAAVGSSSRTFSREMLEAIRPGLEAIDADIECDRDFEWNSRGSAYSARTLNEVVDQLRANISRFKRRHDLKRIIVLDLASAEPTPRAAPAHAELRLLREALANDDRQVISPSIARALAAFMEGCPYVNFTPNLGAGIGALEKLAAENSLAYCGNDAKTGETLLKTVLAPMFAMRNLHVMSWEGVNMLGNNDGRALSDTERREAKIRNKEDVLPKLLKYPVHAGVDINFVPSLGDWKTAWDFIHFKGFLDVPMTMQFTWQGCDSILAAPLALDLVRMAEFAARHGETGPMTQTASFFKNPIAVEEMAFFPQFENLIRYAEIHLARGGSGRNISARKVSAIGDR